MATGPIDFPIPGATGQTYQSPDGRRWEWTGYAWDAIGLGLAGPTGPAGPTAALTLQDVLSNGNTSGGNDILIDTGDAIQHSSLSGGFIDIRSNYVYLTSDANGFTEGWLGVDNNGTLLAWGATANNWIYIQPQTIEIQAGRYASGPFTGNGDLYRTEIGDSNALFRGNASGGTFSGFPSSAMIAIQDVSAGYFNIGTGDGKGVAINTGKQYGTPDEVTQIKQGVSRSVAIGGRGLNVKTDDTAYVNQLSLQTVGATFDGIVVGTTLSADRTWTFPDLSGTVALQDFTSGTDGSVIFIDGNILSEDNSNFFYDRTNARLGLGTTSPDGKLELYTTSNDIAITNLLRFRNNDTTAGSGGGNEQFIGLIDFYGNESQGGGIRGYMGAVQDGSAQTSIIFGTTTTGSGISLGPTAIGGFPGEAMRIDPVGQISIGVGQIIDIDAKLHINNTTSENTILIEDSANPDSTPFLIDNSGMVSIGTTAPKSTIGGVKPKLNVTAGDSNVGATGLPIETVVLVENDTTSYWGFVCPEAYASGIYFGTDADVFGASLTFDYTPRQTILASRVANGTLDFLVGNKSAGNHSIRISPKGGTSVPDADTTIYGDIYLPNPDVPSTATSTGSTGQISWDSDYVYVCVGTNSWKRTQINTW